MRQLFLLFLLLPVFSFKPTSNEQDVFFGDSITFGNELGPLQYSARWSKQYSNDVPSDEINGSKSGAAMTPGLVSGRPVFDINDVLVYQNSYRHIFVSYWVNDFLYGGTPAAFAAATSNAVDGILARGWPAHKIVLCFNYLPESGLSTWPFLTDGIARQWLAALRSVQAAKGTSFLDFYTPIYNRPDKGSYSGDGIHPTAAWNTVMKQYAETNIEGPSSILPVSILRFSGQRQGPAVALKWTVAQEYNVLRYEVERSDDGARWTKAGEVAAAGTTAAERTYGFADNNAAGGRQLYRFRAVDQNGSGRYSNVVVIGAAKGEHWSIGSVFPNPASSAVNVVVNAPAKEEVTLRLVDAAGRTVKSQQQIVEAGANSIGLPLPGVKPGTYFIRLTSETLGTAIVTRLVKE